MEAEDHEDSSDEEKNNEESFNNETKRDDDEEEEGEAMKKYDSNADANMEETINSVKIPAFDDSKLMNSQEEFSLESPKKTNENENDKN